MHVGISNDIYIPVACLMHQHAEADADAAQFEAQQLLLSPH